MLKKTVYLKRENPKHMKGKIVLLQLILLLALTPAAKASHLFGGEITWKCVPATGQYIFTIKIYRDCSGIPLGANGVTSILVWGHPTVCSIPVNPGVATDLSPAGCGYNCASNDPRSVEQWVFTSNPVTLAGTPPASGWIFSWNSCCRNSLDNVGGGGGFSVRSIMYPFNGQNTNPCFDNSPFFAEKPNTLMTVGYPYTYNPYAVDDDRDSLVYSFANPIGEPTNTCPAAFNAPILPFTAPYTVNSPFPGSPNLNSVTGELTMFNVSTIGNFASCVKVTAYKCGIKVAEIYRDYALAVRAGTPVQGGGINLPPVLQAPFNNSTDYDTTVYAGDTVRFLLQATDFQAPLGGGVQNIIISSAINSATMWGTAYTDTNAGCVITPCAILNKTLPNSAPILNNVEFFWTPECPHTESDIICAGGANRYNDYIFVLKASDNSCPIPAANTATIRITVIPPPPMLPPTVVGCTATGGTTLAWDLPAPIDTHHVFGCYMIYADTSGNCNNWTLVDSVCGSALYQNNTYNLPVTALTNAFGPTGTTLVKDICFKVALKNKLCPGDSLTGAPGVGPVTCVNQIHSIFTTAVQVGTGPTSYGNINWNSLFPCGPLSSSCASYEIWREYPFGSGAWVLAGTVANNVLNFHDPFVATICSGNIGYQIRICDALPFTSFSNVAQMTVTNPLVANITGTLTKCPNTATTLTAQPTSGGGVNYTYLWSNSAVTQSISPTAAGNYSVIVTQTGNNCKDTAFVTVANYPQPTATLSGTQSLCSGNNACLNLAFTGTANFQYWVHTPSGGQITGTTSSNPFCVPLGVLTATGANSILNYSLDSVKDANCPATIAGAPVVTVWQLPTAQFTNPLNDTICAGQQIPLSVSFTGNPNYTYSYNAPGGTKPGFANVASPHVFNVSPATTFTYTLDTVRDAHCRGSVSTSKTIVVNPLPTATLSLVNPTVKDTICLGDSSQLQITLTGVAPYNVTLKDNFGNTIATLTNYASTTFFKWVAPTITTTYSLQNLSSSAKNCIGAVSGVIQIVVKPIPTANISPNGATTICNGQQTNLQVAFTGTAPYTFTYHPVGGGNTTLNNIVTNPYSFPVSPATTINYVLTSVSDQFCSRNNINDTVKITVNPLPTAIITGTTSICDNQQTNLSIAFTGTPNFQGQWGPVGGPWTNFNTASNPLIIPVSPNTTTTYALNGNITDGNTCYQAVNPATAIVTVKPLPTATIAGTPTICAGSQAQLQVSFNLAAGTAYSFYYHNATTNTSYGPINTTLNPYTINVSGLAANAAPYSFVLDSVFSNGCKGSVIGSASVTVKPIPTAVISVVDDTICNGDNTNLQILFSNGTAPYYYTMQGQPQVLASGNPQIINVAPTTTGSNISTNTYTLATISDNFCPAIINQAVTVKVIPIPTAAISCTPNICNGQNGTVTVSFTGQGPFSTTYNANPGGNNTASSTTTTYSTSVTPTATTTYTLTGTVTGMYGCSSPVAGNSVMIVYPTPLAVISGNQTICDGTQTNFQINFTGTAPYSGQYSVTGPGGTNTVNFSNIITDPWTVNVTPAAPGTYTYSLIGVNDAHCAALLVDLTGQASVLVNPLPTASITGSDTICFGSGSSITINFTGTPPFDYSYYANGTSLGNFTSATNSVTIPVSPAVSTSYLLGVTITDDNCNGSASTDSAYIRVVPTPTASVAGTDTICNGQQTALTFNFTGEPPYIYTYMEGATPHGPYTTSNASVTVSVSPVLTTNYTLSSTFTGNGCAGPISGNALVTVNQLPTAIMTIQDDTICQGGNTTLSIQFTGSGPFTYQIGSNPVQTATSNPEIIVVSPPGTGTVTYMLTNISDNNCSAVVNQPVNVKVLPNPTANIISTPSLCKNNSGSLTITFTGVPPFSTTYSDGTTSFPVNVPTGNSIVIPITPLTTTTYTLTGTVTSLNGCNSPVSASATTIVYDRPTANISGVQTICIGQTTTLNLNFTGTAPFNYTYINNQSGTTSTGTSATNATTVNVSPSSTSTYNVTVISDAHCTGSVLTGLATVNVNPLPQPVVTGVSAVCDGKSSTLSTTQPYSSYIWSTSATSSTISVNTTGNYSVTVTDGNGCVNTSPAFVFTINPNPVVDFTNDTSLTCDIPRINFTNLSTYQVGATFSWDLGNGTSTQSNPSQLYQLPGNYPITLIVTNPTGCADTLTKSIEIIFYPLAVANFKADPPVTNIYSSGISFIDLSPNAVKWLWDFGDGSPKVPVQNPTHYYPEVGDYKVTLYVENIAGCPSTYELPVVINPFYLPNAFTPNDDGKNDMFFKPGFNLDVAHYTLRIFNRWGQKFFETDNYNEAWDGKDASGKKAPEGVYVYSLGVKTKAGSSHEYNGTVTLIR